MHCPMCRAPTGAPLVSDADSSADAFTSGRERVNYELQPFWRYFNVPGSTYNALFDVFEPSSVIAFHFSIEEL